MIWIRLCGRVLSTDIRWVWEQCCLLHSGEAYGSGPKLDYRPKAGVNPSLVCVQVSGDDCIFSWFLCNVSSCHKAPIFIPKVSLEFLRLSKGAQSLHYLLLPGVTAVIPSVCFSKLLVLANQSSGPQDAKSSLVTLGVYFMKQGRALAFSHLMNDWRVRVTTRIHVIRCFVHSTHHCAKAVSIWREKPEY